MIYKASDIKHVISLAFAACKTIKTRDKMTFEPISFYNVPCAFDIEVSSFYETVSGQPEKRAIMYNWTLGLNGYVIMGRVWDEFLYVIDALVSMLGLGKEKVLVVYVHNLAYEFQFMCKRFTWENVFSIRERKPIYARTTNGIEFRCSYLLSGYSLESIGKNLTKYKVEKLVGNLDYDKVRHSITPMTDKEIAYCENDVLVVMAYIQERIEIDGDITKIPLTKTGYVRSFCRKRCLYGDGSQRNKENKNKYFRYRDITRRLQVGPDEYEKLKAGFQGGFTHASAWKSQKVYEHVRSFDFTSSYPAVMIAERFPMSAAELIKIESAKEFRDNLECYCCLFDVEFIGIYDRIITEHYISASRCRILEGATIDNGRVVCADRLRITITEQDFIVINEFYKWDKIRIGEFRRYRRGYLPKDFVSAILDLYQSKTELKGVKGKEIEYARSKEMINSCYGMAVTDIVRGEIIFDGVWHSEETIEKIKVQDIERYNEMKKAALDKYNKSKNRFLFYPWGVWVTAYARRNLFTGIKAFGNDYIYSDTDSIKVLNADKHAGYIRKYNDRILSKLDRALQYNGFPVNRKSPKSQTGKEKPLGVWDDEGEYKLFKTLGAKRYMTYKGDTPSLTVSGLNKRIVIPYLLDAAGIPYKLDNEGIAHIPPDSEGDIYRLFDLFTNELYIPPGETGKMVHTYIDEPKSGTVTDYLGVTAPYSELSSIHMEPADYSLSLSRAYSDFLRELNTSYD